MLTDKVIAERLRAALYQTGVTLNLNVDINRLRKLYNLWCMPPKYETAQETAEIVCTNQDRTTRQWIPLNERNIRSDYYYK